MCPTVFPAFVERNAPVEADDLGSGLRHRRQQRGAVGAEVDDGNVGFFLQALDELRGRHQRVAAIVFHAQAAHPAVEDLQHVGAGAHLLGGVLGQHVDQLADQLVPDFGRVVHQLLHFEVVPRAAALDHVAGQRERRAAEADHRQLGAEMLRHQRDGVGHVAQFGRAIGAQHAHVFGGAHRLLDDRPFAGREVKGQAHDFQRQQQVGKDDGGVDLQVLRGGDGDFGCELGLLADLDQRVVLAHLAVLLACSGPPGA